PGNIDGRQPQRGQLAARPGPGAAEHEVGGGVGAGHVVEVGTHVVVPQPGGRAAHRLVLAVAGEVEHLDPGLVQGRGAGGDGVVDALRAEGAAGDEQRGALRVEPEGGGTGTAAGRGVGGALGDEVGDGRAQRQPGERGPRQRGAGEGDGDVPGPAGAEAVGQPGPGVLLVDDDRHAQAAGGEVGRGGEVAR